VLSNDKYYKKTLELLKTEGERIVEETYGNRHYISVKAPLVINENVKGMIGFSVDITDKKKLERLQTQLYVNNILQYIPGCIYWKDINGVYLGCNRMEAELLRLNSPDEIIGKTVHDLSCKHTADMLEETDKRIMSTGIAEELIETAIFSSGKKLTMLTRKSPLYVDNNVVIGIIGVSFDITDRKRAEELEKKSAVEKELYEIAKGVAHDICSPISALDMVKYVCNDKLSQKESKMFELAIRSIKNISDRLIKKYRNLEKGVVEEPEIKEDKYILVTNKYLSDIEEFEEKSGFLKICHKMYINDLPLLVI
jgi:PAS domain S-box-containing protein